MTGTPGGPRQLLAVTHTDIAEDPSAEKSDPNQARLDAWIYSAGNLAGRLEGHPAVTAETSRNLGYRLEQLSDLRKKQLKSIVA